MKPVRQPVASAADSRRRLEERLALRFPGVAVALAAAVFRRPPQSRLRRALVRRAVQLGFDAVNRGDFEAALATVFYHPDIEVTEPPEVERLGLDRVSRGLAGRVQVQERWHAEWGGLRFELDEVFDFGDRLLVTARMKGSGLSSGAEVDSDFANIFTLAGGRAIREEMFLDRTKAFEAAGLKD